MQDVHDDVDVVQQYPAAVTFAFAAAAYANAAAALSTQGYGAVEPIPRRERVEAFLREG